MPKKRLMIIDINSITNSSMNACHPFHLYGSILFNRINSHRSFNEASTIIQKWQTSSIKFVFDRHWTHWWTLMGMLMFVFNRNNSIMSFLLIENTTTIAWNSTRKFVSKLHLMRAVKSRGLWTESNETSNLFNKVSEFFGKDKYRTFYDNFILFRQTSSSTTIIDSFMIRPLHSFDDEEVADVLLFTRHRCKHWHSLDSLRPTLILTHT